MAITWVDNVTPLNAVNMNLLEQASNKNVANGYPALDASSNLALAAAQKIIWAGDTSLYRSASKILAMDGFLFGQDTTGGAIFGTRRTGDSGWRWYISTDGNMNWGVGAGSYDTTIYRSGPAALTTDGALQAKLKTGTNTVGFSAVSPDVAVAHWPLQVSVAGEVNPRLGVNQQGTLLFGPGGPSAFTVNLYAADVGAGWWLTTDQSINCPGICMRPGVAGTPSGSRFMFDWTGTSYDAYVDATFIVSIYSSDARNKKSVKTLPSTWDAVKRLNPVSFKYKTQGVFKDDGRTYVGFLAQEVQALIPEGVDVGPESEGSEGLLSLNLNAIVSSLTKALQEAMERIEALEGVTKPA